jgi:hypothetical protein
LVLGQGAVFCFDFLHTRVPSRVGHTLACTLPCLCDFMVLMGWSGKEGRIGAEILWISIRVFSKHGTVQLQDHSHHFTQLHMMQSSWTRTPVDAKALERKFRPHLQRRPCLSITALIGATSANTTIHSSFSVHIFPLTIFASSHCAKKASSYVLTCTILLIDSQMRCRSCLNGGE